MSDIEMHYSFERYWEENASKDTWANKSVAFNIWQSQQAKPDLQAVNLNGANERALSILNHKNVMVDKMQAEIDELQERIDEALKSADINFWNSSTVKDMVDILKGNKDEN